MFVWAQSSHRSKFRILVISLFTVRKEFSFAYFLLIHCILVNILLTDFKLLVMDYPHYLVQVMISHFTLCSLYSSIDVFVLAVFVTIFERCGISAIIAVVTCM